MNAIDRYEVRPAKRSDAPEIARLLTVLEHPTTSIEVRDRWDAWAEAGHVAIVAQRDDGTLAGLMQLARMAVLHRPAPVGRITSLVVDTPDRGRGLGSRLVFEAERLLTHRGCGLLETTSHQRLVDAHSFYEHLGYQRTSVRLAKVLQQPA